MRAARILGVLCLLPAFAAAGWAIQESDSTSQPPAGLASATPAETTKAQVSVPPLIKFTGVLKDLTGKPLVGPVDLTFSLYEEQEGGEPLWWESQAVLADPQGRYTVLLGATGDKGMPRQLFESAQARWLGVQVHGLPESPRVMLVSVPYALKAGDAETLGGKPVSAFMLAGEEGNPGSSIASQPTTSGSSSKGLKQPRSSAALTTATIVGAGTANFLAKFLDASTIGDSVLYENMGNIGVGTTAATERLQVNGNIRLAGQVTHQIQFSGATTSGRIGQDSLGLFAASDTNGASLRFLTNNGTLNEWMRITSDGKLGVGTTGPTQRLQVNGNVLLAGQPTHWMGVSGALASGRFGQDDLGVFVSADTLGSPVRFLTNNGTLGEWVRITSDGKVGVGTPVPAARLDVAGDVKLSGSGSGVLFPDGSKQTSAITFSNSLILTGPPTNQITLKGANSTARFGQDDVGAFVSADTPGSTVRFLTNDGTAKQRMKITSDGLVDVRERMRIGGELIATTGEAVIARDDLDTVHSVVGQAGSGMHFRLSRNGVGDQAGRHFMIAPYNYGMAMEYPGTLEFWVQGLSVHNWPSSLRNEGAAFWVGDETDSGGLFATAHDSGDSTTSYALLSADKFGPGRGSHGSMHFQVRNVTDAFRFQSGPWGAAGTKAQISTPGSATNFDVFSSTVQGTLRADAGVGSVQIGSSSGHRLDFFTNSGVPQMSLLPGGSIGIGTTTPTARLDIAGTAGNFQVSGTGAHLGFTRASSNYIQASSAGGSLDFIVNGDVTSDATSALRLAPNHDVLIPTGRIGIGTLAPMATVDVAGSSGNFQVDATGAVVRFTSGSSNYFQASTTGGSFNIVVNGDPVSEATSALQVTAARDILVPSGKVGIGTTTPSVALEINGGVRLNTALANPICSADIRGTFWVTQAGPEIGDSLQVCVKDANDAFVWKAIF